MERSRYGEVEIIRATRVSATVTVTIPADAVGEWDIGCFEEDGAHGDDGMKGKIIVVSA